MSTKCCCRFIPNIREGVHVGHRHLGGNDECSKIQIVNVRAWYVRQLEATTQLDDHLLFNVDTEWEKETRKH